MRIHVKVACFLTHCTLLQTILATYSHISAVFLYSPPPPNQPQGHCTQTYMCRYTQAHTGTIHSQFLQRVALEWLSLWLILPLLRWYWGGGRERVKRMIEDERGVFKKITFCFSSNFSQGRHVQSRAMPCPLSFFLMFNVCPVINITGFVRLTPCCRKQCSISRFEPYNGLNKQKTWPIFIWSFSYSGYVCLRATSSALYSVISTNVKVSDHLSCCKHHSCWWTSKNHTDVLKSQDFRQFLIMPGIKNKQVASSIRFWFAHRSPLLNTHFLLRSLSLCSDWQWFENNKNVVVKCTCLWCRNLLIECYVYCKLLPS